MKEEKAVWSWLVGAIFAIGIAAAYYWYFVEREPVPEPALAQPPAAEAPVPPQPKAEPQIQHPIEEAQAQPLPALAESDAAMKDALAELLGAKPLREFINLDGIIRRVVATVDNLPREKLAQRHIPVKRVEGRFVVSGADQSLVIGAPNYARYGTYVRLAEATDAKKLVALYVRFYPLFQQAYRELGYPTGYFNDRLVEVIDHLLASPEVAQPVKLVQPHVAYQFADPELESRSAGHKIMIRIGSDSAGRIKAKLQEIRRELTSRSPGKS